MTDPQIQTALRRWMEVIMTRSMREWIRYVKSSGLTVPQFRLLMELYYQGACGISHISDEMSITNAAASQLVDKLVQSGLLERAEDPHDRRARKVTISEAGRSFVKEGIEQRYLWINELAAALSSEERQSIAPALTTLTEKAVSMQEDERSQNEKG
jgi:DNA-binding MarR family transcriptional regulator